MGRKSKAKVRRQEILSHFYEVIIDEGFEGASIAKIAKRMDVNPSLLIHYFSTKDAMVLGLIDYIIETYSSHLIPDFSDVEDPHERWEDFLDVLSQIHWDRIMNNTVFFSCYTLGLRNPEIQKRFFNLYEGIINTLCYELEHAARAEIIVIKDVRKAAEMIVSLIEGANFYHHVNPNNQKQDDRSQLLKTTITSLLNAKAI